MEQNTETTPAPAVPTSKKGKTECRPPVHLGGERNMEALSGGNSS